MKESNGNDEAGGASRGPCGRCRPGNVALTSEQLTLDLQWLVAGIMFLTWVCIYASIFAYSFFLLHDLQNISVTACVGLGEETCLGQCATIALAMFLLGLSGMFLYTFLTFIAFGLRIIQWEDQVMEAQQKAEMRSTLQSQQANVFYSSVSDFEGITGTRQNPMENRFHLRDEMDAEEDDDHAVEYAIHDSDHGSNLQRKESRVRADPAVEYAIHDSDHGSNLQRKESRVRADPAALFVGSDEDDGRRIVRPLAFCKQPCCCCTKRFRRRFPKLYLDPTDVKIKFGRRGRLCDSTCVVGWSQGAAQCCMFPWLVLIMLATIWVVAETDPGKFGFESCDFGNLTADIDSETNFEKEGVQLTWFATLFTWIMFAVFGISAMLRTGYERFNSGKRIC